MRVKPSVNRRGLGHHTYPFISFPSQYSDQTPVVFTAVPKNPHQRYKGKAEENKGSGWN